METALQHWVKVNTDGSLLGDIGTATCRSNLRDHERVFKAAWSINLGSCSIITTELWGVFWGLCLSHNLGYRNVVLESDSNCVIQFVIYGLPVTHNTYSLVLTIKGVFGIV